ncbi:NAD-dependent epimerase/dehydratase family protein [Antarcticibacterium arcticum]|uniref:NAD-dependent epimerase/dehydratase family protein n=1 Tax=Antarcticibacterium arcticum TaxID=2585771 RepID=A0A5B8YKZ2_9FLAO|nr:NAD(P)H-binding protein [Antarcticibacterium arcticum]QED38374.1 NAD-dependent epimerase/dehydratase family protein [Antarcticibacterium arcticum]
MKTAILLGATGLTGGILLQKLLKDPAYGKVVLFSRSSVAVKDEKIEEHLIDLFKLEEYGELFNADVVFCCIGTTKSKTPDEDTYRKIDYGIPVAAAKLCNENGIETFEVISSMGSSPGSKVFYNRIKGEMEEAVLAQNITNTYIFQPSLIAGDRVEKRFFENLAKNALKVLNFVLVGPLKKYRSIHPEIIARAMIQVDKHGFKHTRIQSNEIREIAEKS